MGCNYSQHEIDSCYVPSPILDFDWIIAQCRGNTWKEFEGQKKGGLAEYKEDDTWLHGIRVLTSKQSYCRKCLPMDLVKQPSLLEVSYTSEVELTN